MEKAEKALERSDFEEAKSQIDRALERDPRSRDAWALRARWAEAIEDHDEWVYSLHQQHKLAVTQTLKQDVPKKERDRIRTSLLDADPIAIDLLDLKTVFIDKLKPIANYYEQEKRPHSAIRVHNEILALDPVNKESDEAVQRIASAPDPSLAESAKPRDLLDDVSDQWIRRFNARHEEWGKKATLKRDNYTTFTNAGYEVMVRCAEVMEQVNAFYRVFFNYGTPENDKSVPHIQLQIYKNKEEYHKLGGGVEWSRGFHRSGSAVVTYVGSDGFEGMVRTLFHEAGHQFVHVATNAYSTTWLNEGLATYFEGCRLLNNGTVQFNMPANHYLFTLTSRMENGWMVDHKDGIVTSDPETVPTRAPGMDTVIANRYKWGPAWYAPVWGVTYFFFNYQDPVDGRFIYRKAFREFLDLGGGRTGDGAVKKIEEVVLRKPAAPTKGVAFSEPLKLPKTIGELNETWKEWLFNLREEQSGKIQVKRPYHEWANYALKRKEKGAALEHFEKALIEAPFDANLLLEFGRFLAKDLRNEDRAAKLVRQAIQVLESEETVDEEQLAKADRLLARWDPKLRAVNDIHGELSAAVKNLAQRYLDSDLPLMAMQVSGRYGTELGDSKVLEYFEKGLRRKGKVPWIWKLAYNERDLNGWLVQDDESVFKAHGGELHTSLGSVNDEDFLYQLLTLDVVTSGDFSLQAEVYADAENAKFCGVVMGKKGVQNCQAVVLFPGEEEGRKGFIDLATFYDDDSFDTHRHNPAKGEFPGWHTLRVDVSGKIVDVWFNGELVLTHEFPNLDPLRGGLGLIAGTGESKYRNVRYLSLPPRDPRARIARSLRMEKLGMDTPAGSGGINGSWMSQTPPWFDHLQWIQEPRKSWDEKGPVPTVIAFWSIGQNEVIATDEWLNHLAQEYSDVGIDIVSIVSASDKGSIESYLEDHPVPGSIGMDAFLKKGYGEAFDHFGIGKHYQLPRIVLLDIDQVVVWEGDPGFTSSSGFAEGVESYLEGPMEDLIGRRDLRAFNKWYQAWNAKGRAMLHDGNLEGCSGLLLESLSFNESLSPSIEEARSSLQRLRLSLDSLELTARAFSRQGCEPALETLLAWGELVDRKTGSRTKRALKNTLKCPHASEWSKVVSQVNRLNKTIKPGKEIAVMRTFLQKIGDCDGCFPQILVQELSSAVESDDAAKIREIMGSADQIPHRWLARQYFSW